MLHPALERCEDLAGIALVPDPIEGLGHTPSRVSEVMRGKKGLSMAMVQRLRARFRVPADLLLPPPKKAPSRRSTKRAAA
jgi:transcriptional regulator with XRE-family HTH domain